MTRLVIIDRLLSKNLRRVFLVCLCCALPVTALSRSDTAHEKNNAIAAPVIIFDEHSQRLTVSVQAQPFEKVIEQVAELSATQVMFMGSDYDELTIDFDELPLQEGFKKLLRHVSYLMYTSEDILQVLVFPPGETGAGYDEPVETHVDVHGDHSYAVKPVDSDGQDNLSFTQMNAADFDNMPGLQQIYEQLNQRQIVLPSDVQEIGITERTKIYDTVRAMAGDEIPEQILEMLMPEGNQPPAEPAPVDP